MKCPNCGSDHTAAVKECRKCGRDITHPPVWFPDWKWHVKTLSWIYIILVTLFFVSNHYLHKLKPPYHLREVPVETTPWLRHAQPAAEPAGTAQKTPAAAPSDTKPAPVKK